LTPALASLLYPKFILQTYPPGCKRHTYKLNQSIHIRKFKRSTMIEMALTMYSNQIITSNARIIVNGKQIKVNETSQVSTKLLIHSRT